ncbi:MAG: sigma 54-interacting transcriptional regulator [Clostridiales Family XIII bacterium]|nr:sigma 54-interacting transcriptional regulator [Clostridiales Family XIII bacterium]
MALLQSAEDELYLFKTLIDSMPDQGIMIVDAEKHIIYYSAMLAEKDGVNREQAYGQHVDHFFRLIPNDPINTVLKSGEPLLNFGGVYETSDGRALFSFANFYPIKKIGEVIAVCYISRFLNEFQELLSQAFEVNRQYMLTNRGGTLNAKYQFSDLIGCNPDFLAAVRLAKKIALNDCNVLICGETGAGKELFAQSIHNAGPRQTAPFLAVNCSAIPDTLLESTLFGTVKGAFTGAENMTGLFEQAENGTILLDELNSMPLHLQAKLLRVLEDRHFRRIGAKSETPLDCRILSSLNKEPSSCIKDAQLRPDLYYRLAAVEIDIPPLRERPEDIPLLSDYFCRSYVQCALNNPNCCRLTEQAAEAMKQYSWPGNIRELKHVIERIAITYDIQEPIPCHFLPPYIMDAVASAGTAGMNDIAKLDRENRAADEREDGPESSPCQVDAQSLKQVLQAYERKQIQRALDICAWNLSRTARMVGYTRTNLIYRMKILSIEKPSVS